MVATSPIAATFLLMVSLGFGMECHDEATCIDASADAARGSAMLQVSNTPVSTLAHEQNITASKARCAPALLETHIDEARHCLPDKLIEKHLSAVRYQATLLSTGKGKADAASKEEESEAAGSQIDGSTASLDAAGFKAVTSLCCPPEMQTFWTRLLASMGLKVCSLPHLAGLMHWFSCVPNMDFQYVLDIINNGNPCKYWAPEAETCPQLSDHCQGIWCR
jgi:hypothetical protein